LDRLATRCNKGRTVDHPYVGLVLHFVSVFTAMLVAGGQVFAMMVIIPTKRRFSERVSVEVHNAMLGHQTDIYMKPAAIISFITAVALVALQYSQLPVRVLVFSGIGMAGTLGVVFLSRFFNVPANTFMLTWSLDNIPKDYPEIRRKWDLVHTIRTGFGVLAFTGYFLAALTRYLPDFS
jgi:amino acid transporter